MEGVDPSLRGGLFRVDCCFIVEGSLVEVDEVRGGSSSPGRTIPGIVPHLSALKAGIVVCAGCHLSDAVSCRSPLLPPLVWGSGAAKVHRNGSVVKSRGSSRRVYRRGPVSDRVSVCGGVWWGPSPHSLLGVLEEWLGRLSPLLGCVSPISCVRSPRITLVAKHALDDLAGPGSVNCFLFHLFISGQKRSLHYFGGNGS